MKHAPARRKALFGIIGFLLAAYGCVPKTDISLPEEDRLLEDVMEAYVAERFRFYPVESTLSGLPVRWTRGSVSGFHRSPFVGV